MQIIGTSIVQTLHELRANKLRTFLSLLGITIGIFCIIAVLTTLDTMEDKIQQEMSGLGSDVIYIGRWPWMDDGGQYKWWEYRRRPGMTVANLNALIKNVPDAKAATLSLSINNQTIKHETAQISGVSINSVEPNYDKIENIELGSGRYFSLSELEGGGFVTVLGFDVADNLLGGEWQRGEYVNMMGRPFEVIGIMKKVGQNMAGADFDNSVLIPFNAAAALVDVSSLNYDPTLIIKAKSIESMPEVEDESEGILRSQRRLKPGQPNNFAINQLSQISERLSTLFASVDAIGLVIGGFSLLVGSFGIANIMFVTVKERTRIIGVKKAIGARSGSIMTEFLIEAVTLCLLGGLAGVLIVLLTGCILNLGFNVGVTLSLKNFTIGVGISAVVGILAGFIPARSAARLDPVVAIRTN